MGQKLWGIKSGNEDKPFWLTDAQKENTFATNAGWVLRHNSGIEETLIAIADLKTKLGATSVTEVRWVTGAYAGGTTKTVRVTFNEKITVTGSPTINITPGAGIDTITGGGGTGYTTATVTITGDGAGATATATILGGVITGFTVTAPGHGYTYANVTITGDGTNATGTAVLLTPTPVTATYSATAGQGNVMVFSFTVPVAPDLLRIYAQSIALNGGTIVETGVTPTVNADLVITAAAVAATGSKVIST